MNSHVKRIFTLFLTLLIIFSHMTVKAESDKSEFRKGYIYPVQPGSEGWEALNSHDEMIKVTRIPNSKLIKFSTAQLIQVILDHPLLGEIYAYNSLQKGYKQLTININALAELEKRKDAPNEAFKVFKEMLPAAENTVSVNQRFDESISPYEGTNLNLYMAGKQQLKIALLAIYLAQPKSLAALTSSSKDELTSLALAQENQIDLQSGNRFTIAQSAIDLLSGKLLNIEGGTSDCGTKTPKGTCLKDWSDDSEWNWADIQYWNLWVKWNYPQATRGSDASKKYNCHSYAWNLQSTSNTVWINDNPSYSGFGGVRSYWRDGSYSQTYGAATKIWYENGDHSAIFYDSTRYRSKWGALPQMVHTPKYSPYNSSIIKYFTKN